MFKFLSLVLVLLVFFQFVYSDDIYIYGPPQNGIYHPKDIMDIRYRVRSMGMTRIWATSAKLIHIESNKTIDQFPLVNWSSNDISQDKSSIHQIWTIPADIPIGNYSLAIGGNATYLCSKNGSGSAPFKHCESVIYKYTTFFITNGTLSIDNSTSSSISAGNSTQ